MNTVAVVNKISFTAMEINISMGYSQTTLTIFWPFLTTYQK